MNDELQKLSFDLGWDYRIYRLKLPPDLVGAMQEGWDTAKDRTTKTPDRYILKFLYIRFSALKRNRVVSSLITPDLIRVMDETGICPITRQRLTYGTQTDSDWSLDRINNNGGYAPGNLVVMSARANMAKSTMAVTDILDLVERMVKDKMQVFKGLSLYEWKRLLWLANKCDDLGPIPYTLNPPPFVWMNNFDRVQWFLPACCFHPDVKREFNVNRVCSTKATKKALTKYIKVASTIMNMSDRGYAFFDRIPDSYLLDSVYSRFIEFLLELYNSGDADRFLDAAKKFMDRAEEEPGIVISDAELEGTWSMDSRGYLKGVEEQPSPELETYIKRYIELHPS
jgi:hypothetical protein